MEYGSTGVRRGVELGRGWIDQREESLRYLAEDERIRKARRVSRLENRTGMNAKKDPTSTIQVPFTH